MWNSWLSITWWDLCSLGSGLSWFAWSAGGLLCVYWKSVSHFSWMIYFYWRRLITNNLPNSLFGPPCLRIWVNFTSCYPGNIFTQTFVFFILLNMTKFVMIFTPNLCNPECILDIQLDCTELYQCLCVHHHLISLSKKPTCISFVTLTCMVSKI